MKSTDVQAMSNLLSHNRVSIYFRILSVISLFLVVVGTLSFLTSPVQAQGSDRDGDGIPDSTDACPGHGNEGGLGTDASGCPYYDADWDGVYDRNDACPWRADEYGFGVGSDGCPLTGEVATEAPTEAPSQNPPDTNTDSDTDDATQASPPSNNNNDSSQNDDNSPSDNHVDTTEEPTSTEEPVVTEEADDIGQPRDWIRDADGDGIPDTEDACPWRGNEGGLGVDESGCPYYDADWDGFVDRIDACPWRGNEGGLGVDFTGCPYYDADWDGIYDRNDACPWRGDEYGYGIDETGCPLEAPEVTPEITPEITPEVTPEITEEPPVDSDGDGIFDRDDLCPDEGDAGFGVNSSGCPLPDPTIIIEGIDFADCALDSDNVDFTCIASSVCDGVIAQFGFGEDDSCVDVALTFINDFDFPEEPVDTGEPGDNDGNLATVPAAIIALLIALVSYIVNYIQEQILATQLRQELEGFGLLTDLVDLILNSWNPAQITELLNNYLPTMDTIGYSLAEIENILQNALDGSLFDFFNLSDMLDEMTTDTGDEDLYIWDMNDPSTPHLFPPNPDGRGIVFNVHGWNTPDADAADAYSNNAAWFDTELPDGDPIVIGIDWNSDINIEEIPASIRNTLTLIDGTLNSARTLIGYSLPLLRFIGAGDEIISNVEGMIAQLDQLREQVSSVLTSQDALLFLTVFSQVQMAFNNIRNSLLAITVTLLADADSSNGIRQAIANIYNEFVNDVYSEAVTHINNGVNNVMALIFDPAQEISRITGQALGELLQQQAIDNPHIPIAVIGHSLGNQLLMEAIDANDVYIDMYIGVQAAVAHSMIAADFDDILDPAEVEEIRMTYNEFDFVLQGFGLRDGFGGDFAIGNEGLYSDYEIPLEFAHIENIDVSGAYLPWQYAGGHQTINISNANAETQAAVLQAMQDFLGIA